MIVSCNASAQPERSAGAQICGTRATSRLVLAEQIERVLRASALMRTEPEHPTGCLVVLAGGGRVSRSRQRPRAAGRAPFGGAAQRDGLRAPRRRGQRTARRHRPGEHGRRVHRIPLGGSVESRDGTQAGCLDAAIDHLMQVWDARVAAAA